MEIFGELAVLILNIAIGMTLAPAAYWVWIGVRRRLWGLDRPLEVATPSGERFSLSIPRQRFRLGLSRRLLRVEQGSDTPAPRWHENDRLHPARLIETADDFTFIVAPVVLIVVLLLVLLLALELIIALVAFGIVWTVGLILRRPWTCVVAGADDAEWHVDARGLRAVRQVRTELADAIAMGDCSALNP